MTDNLTNNLAIIDISKDDMETAKALVDAASTMGFVMIEGSGFTIDEVDKVFDISREFFAEPTEKKSQLPLDQVNNHGYTLMRQERLDPEHQQKGDPKEAFNMSQGPDGKLTLPLPDILEPHRETLNQMWIKCHDIGDKILRLLAKGLEIEESAGGSEWLVKRHNIEENSGSVLRFLYYPGQKKLDSDIQIRAGAHTDYGSVTLLFQKKDEEGLEILSPISKKWEPVTFIESKYKDQNLAPPLIVNIADLLSFWTAGVLKSSIHRVKFPPHVQESGKDRYSIVYFLHPQHPVPLEPIPSPIVQKAPARGSTAQKDGKYITAQEHLNHRIAVTYGRY